MQFDVHFFQPTWRGLLRDGVPMLVESAVIRLKVLLILAKAKFTW